MGDNYKNIIYGQEIQTKFGHFRSFCSPLSTREQLQPTMKHLQKHQHFKKYNKLIFAFRINIQGGDQFQEEQYEEGYSEDEVFDSIGDRLLNLLRKYNVENVLAILAVEQHDPLFAFDQQVYHLVIDLTKDLLNTLYTKLVEQKNQEAPVAVQPPAAQSDLFLTDARQEMEPPATQPSQARPLQTTSQNENYGNIQLYDFPLQQSHSQERFQARVALQKRQRANHVFKNQKPQKVSETSQQSQISCKTKQLINRINHYGIKIERIIESLDQQDYQQIKFMLQYESNNQLEKIMAILLIFYDQTDLTLLTQECSSTKNYSIQNCIQDLNVNQLNYQKTKQIKQILITDRQLNYNSLFQVSPALANIFLILSYLVFSFELGIDLIEQQNLLFSLKQQPQMNKQPAQSHPPLAHLHSGKNFIIRQRKNVREPAQVGHEGISGHKMAIAPSQFAFESQS